MNNVLQTGNAFNASTLSFGHAKKVWRRIDEQLPGGYRILNVSDFVEKGLIRSGMAVVKAEDADEKDVNVLQWQEILDSADSGGVDSLNILGFLQEDVPVKDVNTYATGNIIVKGEIYGYMLGDTPTEANSVAPMIKLMTQKNGLSIRVVD